MLPILASILPQALGILDDLIPDKDAAAKAKVQMESKLLEAASAANIAQIDTNKIEAASPNVWVSGWRPAIGWCCATGIFWVYVGYPMATWGLAVYGIDHALPDLKSESLMELTFAMLGMAGLRTFEKMKGVTK